MKPPFLNSSLFSKAKTPASSSPYSSAPTTPPSATLQPQPFSSDLAFKPDSLLTVSYPTIYIAICDHITDDPTLLSFKQGDSIKVMNKLPSGWWEGHLVESPYNSTLGIAPGQPMGLPTEFVAKNGFFPGKFVQKFEEDDGYGESAPSLKSPPTQLSSAQSIMAPKKNTYEQSVFSKRKDSNFSDTPSEIASISNSVDLSYLTELKEALASGGGPKGLLENEWIADLYPKIKLEIIPEKFTKSNEEIPKYWIKQSLPLSTQALSIAPTSSTSSLSSNDSDETLDYYIQLITDEASYTSPESWLGNLSNDISLPKENDDKDSQILSRKNSISSIASASSADSETIATYDPIAIPRQYRRPSAIGANLDSLEVQSDLSWVNLSTEVILSINKLRSTVDSSIQLDYLSNASEVVKSIQKLFEGTGITNFNSVIFSSQPELKDIYKQLIDLLGKIILLLLNSINVWSLPDFKDRFSALVQQVLDLCRAFVSKCQSANIRCRPSNSVASPIASSFGNVSLRRGSTDIGESNSCPGDLSNRLNQLILIISSDITKIQKINPASFASNPDESFCDNSSPISEQIINHITSLLNHSGEVLTAVGGISVSNTNNLLSEKYDSILAGVYWKTAQLVIHLQSISPLLDFGRFLPIRKLCKDVHSELMKLVILSKLIINEQAIHDFLQMRNEIEMVKVNCFLSQETNSSGTQPSCPFQELHRLLNTVPSRSTIVSLKRSDSKSSNKHNRTSDNFENTLSGDFSSLSMKVPPKNPLRSRASMESLGKLHHTRSSASLNRPSLPPIPASPDVKPHLGDKVLSSLNDELPLPPTIPLPAPPTIPLPTPPVSKTSIDTDRSSKVSSKASSKRSSNISIGPKHVANYLKSPPLLAVFNCAQHCSQHQFDLNNRTGAFIQQEPWFIKKDYRDADLVLDDESVLGATLPRLIEYLTPFQNPNSEYIETFLLTYRGFTTTFNLFELLFKRFTDESPSEIHPHMRMDYVKYRLGPIRQRVMEVLWIWLDNHMQEDETEALKFLEEFASTIMMKIVPEQARNFVTLLNRRLKASKSEQTNYYYRPWGTKVKRFKLDILQLQVIEFAYQLTMSESFHFEQIDPRELLNLEWEKPLNSKNFHIRALMYVSNCISSWVARAIIAAKDTNRCTKYMEFFIQLASTLRMLNNFNGLMSILMGFNTVPVEDLTNMWAHVNPEHRETAARLTRTMDPANNFGAYREALGQIKGPVVPFLGAFVSDLRFIEESHPNYLPDNSELINFEKQKKVATIIKEIRRLQKEQSGFNYKGCKPYLDYLHTIMSKMGIINPLYPSVKDFDPKLAQTHLKIKNGSFAMDNFLSETGLLV